MADIRKRFPSLTSDNHHETSDEDFNYNCLAFVLGDYDNWWQPPEEFEEHSHAPGIYWPPGFSTDTTVGTVTAIIRLHGYTVEIDRASEPSAPAIAIFASGEEWAHFAKYLGGRWHSKVGRDHDISHSSLDLLEGPDYGR